MIQDSGEVRAQDKGFDCRFLGLGALLETFLFSFVRGLSKFEWFARVSFRVP